MLSIVFGSVISARTFISPPQCPQTSGFSPKILLIRWAPAAAPGLAGDAGLRLLLLGVVWYSGVGSAALR
jgi:hypothetical protein